MEMKKLADFIQNVNTSTHNINFVAVTDHVEYGI